MISFRDHQIKAAKARASKLSPEQRKAIASMGGKARAKNLKTPASTVVKQHPTSLVNPYSPEVNSVVD